MVGKEVPGTETSAHVVGIVSLHQQVLSDIFTTFSPPFVISRRAVASVYRELVKVKTGRGGHGQGELKLGFQDLLLSTLNALHKLTIFEQNKERLVQWHSLPMFALFFQVEPSLLPHTLSMKPMVEA